jgi:hypothetical protein
MRRLLLLCGAALLWPALAVAEADTIKLPRNAGGAVGAGPPVKVRPGVWPEMFFPAIQAADSACSRPARHGFRQNTQGRKS